MIESLLVKVEVMEVVKMIGSLLVKVEVMEVVKMPRSHEA